MQKYHIINGKVHEFYEFYEWIKFDIYRTWEKLNRTRDAIKRRFSVVFQEEQPGKSVMSAKHAKYDIFTWINFNFISEADEIVFFLKQGAEK